MKVVSLCSIAILHKESNSVPSMQGFVLLVLFQYYTKQASKFIPCMRLCIYTWACCCYAYKFGSAPAIHIHMGPYAQTDEPAAVMHNHVGLPVRHTHMGLLLLCIYIEPDDAMHIHMGLVLLCLYIWCC